MVLGSLFCGVRATRRFEAACYLWFASCALLVLLLRTAARATTASRGPSRRGAEAAPHGFLRARFRPRRVIGAPPPRRDGFRAGPSRARIAGCRCKELHRGAATVHRCPAGAQGTRDRSPIECCDAALRVRARAALPAMKPHCHAVLLLTLASAHAPKAANISQTPYRRKAAVFASLEDGTAVLFSGKTKDVRVNNGSDLRVLKCRDAFTPSTCTVSRNDGRGWSFFRF